MFFVVTYLLILTSLLIGKAEPVRLLGTLEDPIVFGLGTRPASASLSFLRSQIQVHASKQS